MGPCQLLVFVTFIAVISGASKFEVSFQWNFINFTWNSAEQYQNAVANNAYIANNNAMVGIKYYKDRFYIATPRIRSGTPVTLGSIPSESPKVDPLITPFPNWEMNDISSCDNLQSVQSMEIDSNGIMWVIDGMRTRGSTCPPKLILFDLNNNSNIIHTYEFPEDICLSNGGFLNDIVVDDDYAYITDHSGSDPGLIVYSLNLNRSWKFRDDTTMRAESNAQNFEVGGTNFGALAPIDGIALDLKTKTLYYCPLTAFHFYSISTNVLKNEAVLGQSDWVKDIKVAGMKPAQSDGMVVDNAGVLYYGLLPLDAVGFWNTSESYTESDILDVDHDNIIWPDSFGFDDKGYLYLLADNINKYFDSSYDLSKLEGFKFHIVRTYTGTNSYLY